MKLKQKLLEIKKSVPYLKPNERGFNYDYANPSRVLGVFNPLFNEHNIFLTSEVLGVKTKTIEINREKNEKVDVKTEVLHIVDMKFTFVDIDSDETISVLWAGTGSNGIEQGFGSALTYAQRYFLLNYFGVPVDKEDPNYVSNPNKEENKEPLKKMTATISKQMINALKDGKRTPAQIRTALATFESNAQTKKVEEELLNL